MLISSLFLSVLHTFITLVMDEFITFVKPAPINEAPTKKQKKQMAGQKKLLKQNKSNI